MMPLPTLQMKVVLLGDSGVGKSSLLERFVSDSFNQESGPTLGASFLSKEITVDSHTIKFNIWDTAGQERYHALAKMYYRDASAAVLVFDLTNAKSFQDLQMWLEEMHDHGPKNLVLAVAANKEDLVTPDNELVKTSEKWATENNAVYRRTSAKTSSGVDQLFRSIGKSLLSGPESIHQSRESLHRTPNAQKNKCCG